LHQYAASCRADFALSIPLTMTKPPTSAIVIFLAITGLIILLFATGFVRDIVTGPPQPMVRTSGKALIKAVFSLTDHTGKPVTEKQFRGKFLLVFFGYTFCPDVCPAELQIMSAALDKLGAKASRIQPLFITIDPSATPSGKWRNMSAIFTTASSA